MNNMHEDNQKERDQGTGMGLAVAHGIIKTWAGPSQSDVWTVREFVMSNMKEIVNQRRYARFRVPKDAFAALGPDYIKVGQIINISMGGLVFRYLYSEVPSNASELDIFLAGRAFYLYKLPFETVWDSVTNEMPFSSINMKVCGLQFGGLTDEQKSDLRYFIQNHAIGRARPKS
jgi:hypothetical protein